MVADAVLGFGDSILGVEISPKFFNRKNRSFRVGQRHKIILPNPDKPELNIDD
jgi:hypothetical protein